MRNPKIVLSVVNQVVEEGNLGLNLKISIQGELPACFMKLAKDNILYDVDRVLNDFRDTYLPRSNFSYEFSDLNFDCREVCDQEVSGDA